ncbi:phage tail sheath family protein [Paenibacillus chungangensis]|uniref:Phage tail sheath family protein n=1 Tax=Paenibacillus chungangensis TaxID=696535 RepID=A0ABW3HQG6_9BACL
MTGGTWTTHNKVRPGVYVNMSNAPKPLSALGERGMVTMPLVLSWGEPKTMITIEAGEDTMDKLGYSIAAPQMLLVREALKRARTLLLYRVNEGVKAAVTGGELTATAKYGGERGNAITIVVEVNVDDPAKFDVRTMVEGAEKDVQTVSDIAGLSANNWVTWNASGQLAANAGMPLAGGANGDAQAADYNDYLSAAETEEFQTIALVSEDSALKSVFASFVEGLRDGEGRKVQVAIANYSEARQEGVISVNNGVKLADGTVLTAAQAAVWVAGATAAAGVNESLTYTLYDGAVDAVPRLTHTETVTALRNGEFLFTQDRGSVRVEQDINTFTSFTPEKGAHFSKNRVVRVLDAISNDCARVFRSFYIGKVSNHADGRNLLKGECINYLTNLQNLGAIGSFDSQNDVKISPIAGQPDGVYIELQVQPIDAVEKIYIAVEVM